MSYFKNKNLASYLQNVNLIYMLCGLIIGGLIACHMFCGCFNFDKLNVTEGLDNMDSPWTKSPIDAKAYYNNMYASLSNNEGGPVPPAGLNLFAKNVFKHECCQTPQQYSSSNGCACISPEQMKYISSRGGNNTLP